MNWCPVEWPTTSHTGTMAKIQAKQSGKKATLAGILGIVILLLMVAVVMGYAIWSKRIALPQTFERAQTVLREVIYGEVPVTLIVDGKTATVKTKGKSVRDLLREQGVNLNQKDQVTPTLTTPIKKNMKIKVIRVTVKTEIKETAIPFITERIANPEIPRGFTRKVKVGQEGLQKETWQIRFEDGVEVARTCVAKNVLKEPVNGLVQYGTQSVVSRGGTSLHFSRALEMVATGYSHSGYNTATGVTPQPGVIAVDPNIIPLGTRLYVDGYGRGVALDTGGAIKGNRIDLFYNNENQALQWGVRTTKVYVLD